MDFLKMFPEILSGIPPGIFLGASSGFSQDISQKIHVETGPRVSTGISSEIPFGIPSGVFLQEGIPSRIAIEFRIVCIYTNIFDGILPGILSEFRPGVFLRRYLQEFL